MLQVMIPDQATWSELFLALKARGVPIMLGVAVDTERIRNVIPRGGRFPHRNGKFARNGSGSATHTILDVVKTHPGWTATQIRTLLPNMDSAGLSKWLKRLADSGTIKATGKRRARRYRVAENRAAA